MTMRFSTIAVAVLMAAGLTGCATMNDTSDATAEREDILLLREDINRLKGRIETVDMEYKRLLDELEKVRASSSGSKDQDSVVRGRLDDMDRRIQALDAARAKDRQAIVDQLSGKMADIMAASGGKSAPKGGPKSTPKSGGKDAASTPAAGATGTVKEVGVEHIVNEGETLTAIAAAYKVKTADILKANNLKSGKSIKVGQKLFIPKS